MTVPLQFVDSFLLNYHVGHVLILLFALAVLADVAVIRSWKVMGLIVLLFGVLFVATPAGLLGTTPLMYKVAGGALMVVGPVVYTVLGG